MNITDELLNAQNSKTEKIILLAINSNTIMNLLKSIFEKAEKIESHPFTYKILSVDDGQKAMDILFSQKIDLVITFTELPCITGYAICRLVKNTVQISHVPIILCSCDENGYNFWAKNSCCDSFLIFDSNNENKILETAQRLLEKNKNKKEFISLASDEKSAIDLVTKAYDRELFELYLYKTVTKRISNLTNLNEMIENTAADISGLYNYDAISIIINGATIKEYFERASNISEDDFNAFKTVCHADFEKMFPDKKDYDWTKSTYRENQMESFSEQKDHLKSYAVFPTPGKEGEINLNQFFSIHIASCHENNFDEEITEKLNLFAKVYANILANAILYKNTFDAEEKMHRIFTQFIPAKLLDDPNQKNSSIGEVHKVAILIADIRNFTNITENLRSTPEKIVNFLNNYFTIIGRIVEKNGGTIDKFMGDAIMVLFGATGNTDNNGYRAAKTALEMQAAIENLPQEILEDLQLKEGQHFQVGIGIHYGDPVVGVIGSEEKKDFTVIGDDVNLASRVEGLTKLFGVKIIITENVKKDIDEVNKKYIALSMTEEIKQRQIRSLGKALVKGKENCIRIFELYDNPEKYSQEYLTLYRKGLHQFMLGDFDSALTYFTKARNHFESIDTLFMIKRTQELMKIYLTPESLLSWDGAISVQTK